MAPDMSEEFVISLALSLHSKNLRWWTIVIAQLQLRLNCGPVLQLSYNSVLFWQAKDNTSLRCEGGLTQKGEASIHLGFLFSNVFVCSPLSLPYANWASKEGSMFVSPEVLTPVHGFSFVPFLQAFPFLCLLATILDSFSYSNSLILSLQLV